MVDNAHRSYSMEIEGPMIRTVYRDLDNLHDRIEQNRNALQALADIIREFDRTTAGDDPIVQTVERVISGLDHELDYIRTLEDRIRCSSSRWERAETRRYGRSVGHIARSGYADERT
jgi:hypothetical protein